MLRVSAPLWREAAPRWSVRVRGTDDRRFRRVRAHDRTAAPARVVRAPSRPGGRRRGCRVVRLRMEALAAGADDGERCRLPVPRRPVEGAWPQAGLHALAIRRCDARLRAAPRAGTRRAVAVATTRGVAGARLRMDVR